MEKLLRPYALTAKEAMSKLNELQRTPLGKVIKPTSVLAINCNTYEIEGILIFVGNVIQMKEHFPEQYKQLVLEHLSGILQKHSDEDTIDEIDTLLDYDWAIVRTEEYDSMQSNIYTVFNYDCDPSGVITLK